MAKSMFKGLKTAQVSKDANYFRGEGDYLMKITRVKQGENRSGIGFFAVEGIIIHQAGTRNDHEHKVGEEVTWLTNRKSDYFLSDVIKFVEATFGENLQEMPDGEGEEFLEALTDEETNPMFGTIVRVTTRTIKTKEDKSFTKVNWKEEVSAIDALEILDEKVVKAYFPDGYLEKKAEKEAKEAA